MDSHVNYIRQRLSLRKPLVKALELTAAVTDALSLQKPPTDAGMLDMFIAAELAKVKAIVPAARSFDSHRHRQNQVDGCHHHISLSCKGYQAFFHTRAESDAL